MGTATISGATTINNNLIVLGNVTLSGNVLNLPNLVSGQGAGVIAGSILTCSNNNGQVIWNLPNGRTATLITNGTGAFNIVSIPCQPNPKKYINLYKL
jgi:hypothetical protein